MNAIFDIKPVVAAAGLGFEARIAQGPGVKVVYGQSRDEYRKYLHNHAKCGVSGFISIGVAGGLSPRLRPGDVVVASAVITASGISSTCRDWSKSILSAIPGAHHMPVFASGCDRDLGFGEGSALECDRRGGRGHGIGPSRPRLPPITACRSPC